MIKSNELRIGNYIEYNGKARKVTALAENDIVIDGFAASEFNAISITREILEKLGAAQFPDRESLILCDRLIGFAECRSVFFDRSTSVELRYVHQLQNLYFVLTDVELEINL